jgi:hypothetical protein
MPTHHSVDHALARHTEAQPDANPVRAPMWHRAEPMPAAGRPSPSPRTRTRRRGRALRRIAATASLIVVVVAAVSVVAGAQASLTIPKHAVRLQIGAAAISGPIPTGFVGLSIEYQSLLPYAGDDPAAPDPVFLALVRALAPGRAPVLRFGGDTTDWTWWPTPGVARPGGVRFTLSPRWVAVAHAVAAALGARMIMGVNFEADSRAIAGAEARALVTGIGRRYIAGLELGNEPEVYGTLSWYTTPSGRPVYGRPASYGVHDYLADEAAISRALPRDVPIAGPASGAPQWLTGLGRYLAANPRVRIATFHRYPLHRCFTARTSGQYPTIPHLLSSMAATEPAVTVAAAVAVAHAHGVPFRVDELNSVSCGGARGVSDSFASALWIIDALFHLVRVGADGVNVHTFHNAIYAPFTIARRHGRWEARVRPLYYGLLLFARAAPAGARLLAVSGPAVPGLQTWATRAPDGTVRLLLVNQTARRVLTVAARAPGAVAAATLQRLRAPGLGARGSITLGGATFGSATSTGRLSAGRTVALGVVQGRYSCGCRRPARRWSR